MKYTIVPARNLINKQYYQTEFDDLNQASNMLYSIAMIEKELLLKEMGIDCIQANAHFYNIENDPPKNYIIGVSLYYELLSSP